jgi:two-component sensor histidine kinase
VGQRAENTIALIFHELATNAAKYGASSNEEGALAVTWATDTQDIRLSWKEAGGPVVQPPTKASFGSVLVDTTIKRIGGEIAYEWHPQAMQANLRLPLQALSL